MTPRFLYLFIFPLIWGISISLLAASSILARPTLPVFMGDELRQLAIAWEMWLGGNWLIPHINGKPSTTDLPMLSWVINLGWAAFGVSEIWPRAISPLFGFASIFMTAAIARLLWPGWAGIGALSGTILMGSIVWSILITLPSATPIAVFCLLVAFWGLIYARESGRWGGSILAGIFAGLGMLTIGPKLLIYILPVMVLEFFRKSPNVSREAFEHNHKSWQILTVFGLGILIVIIWLVFVFIEQNNDYTLRLVGHLFMPDLFNSQIEQNKINWIYTVLLAGFLLLPWLLWGPAWRALAGVRYMVKDSGVWVCLLWILPVLISVVLSPNGGLQGLMFALPAFALMMGFLIFLHSDQEIYRLHSQSGQSGQSGKSPATGFGAILTKGETLIGLTLALLGAVVIILPLVALGFDLPWWMAELSGGWGAVMLIMGALIAMVMPRTPGMRALLLSAVSISLVALGFLVAKPMGQEHTNLDQAAMRIASLQQQGTPVAYVGDYLGYQGYQGEFAFAGRLVTPIDILDKDDPLGIIAWIVGNPNAEVITIHKLLPADVTPLAVFPWWGQYMVFWSAEAIEANPGLMTADIFEKAS